MSPRRQGCGSRPRWRSSTSVRAPRRGRWPASAAIQIALIYDNHSPHYIHQIQTGVWARCIEEGVRLLAQPSDAASTPLADEVGGLIDQTQVDGVILSSPVTDAAAALDELERRGIPYVRISPGTDHGRSLLGFMDDVQAADEMTSHLIALGHRRIGFIIGHTNHTASDLRLYGYRRALDRAGIDFEPKYVRQGHFDFASGEAAADACSTCRSRRPRSSPAMTTWPPAC